MRTLFLLLVLFSLSGPGNSYAQKKTGQTRIDSLLQELAHMKEDTNGVKLMDALALAYCYTQPDEAMQWAEKELALAQKTGWRKGEAWGYNMQGSIRQTKGDYSGALEDYFQSLRIEEEIGDKLGMGNVTGSIGGIYTLLGKYEKGLKWQLKALKLSEETGNKRVMSHNLSNIAMSYLRLHRLREALAYQQKGIAVAEELNNPTLLSQALGNLATIYMNTGAYNEALQHYFRALRLGTEAGNKQLIAISNGNIGTIYWLIADSTVPRQDSLVPAGREANLSLAVLHLQKAIITAREAQLPQYIPELTRVLSNTYAAGGNHKAAFEAYKQYVSAKDSLDRAGTLEKIAGLETKRALELKDKDIQISRLAVAKKRNERVFYLSGISLLLVIMGIIIYNFRKHERSRQHIKKLQDHRISQLDEAVKRRTEQLGSMRQTIATDFHDQTGNMLAAITRQAATLELKLLLQPDVLPMVRSIISNANELYASSKDFIWNLNHDSDDPFILFQYLSGYGQRFYNQFDIAFSTAIDGEPQPSVQLPPFAGLNLIYIFKEAMSNVVKHSGADEVHLELRWESGQVTYWLQDNGTWKEADPVKEHYGLGNMERRCRQSGLGFKLSHDLSGTRIAISLPVDFIHAQQAPLSSNS